MENKSGGDHDFKFINKIFYIVTSIYFILIFIYFSWLASHGNIISSNSEYWGTFGDFIGGVTNPIIALAILFFVIQSYKSNKLEMNIIKNEMKKQRVISVYGEFLTYYRNQNEILKNVSAMNVKILKELAEDIGKKRQKLRISVAISDREDIEKQIDKSLNEMRDINKELGEIRGSAAENRDKVDVYIQNLEELLN